MKMLKLEVKVSWETSPTGFPLLAITEFKLYNKRWDSIEKGVVYVKELNLESKEFKRVMHNLHLESLSLSPAAQKRVLELINAKTSITPTLIKDILRHGKV